MSDHLALADRHIEEALARIERQQALIDGLNARGLDSQLARMPATP